jgi:hypothetical protein
MPVFTAFIDRNENRKVIVTAETAAHAREYATARYGKVTKLKVGGGVEPQLTETLRRSLAALSDGLGIYPEKRRRLRVLGLIDVTGRLTDTGRAALAQPDRLPETATGGETSDAS